MVALDITVGTSGMVEDIVVIRSIPLLDQAAIDAVRQWEYEPVVIDGRTVPVVMTVGVGFTLPEADDWVVEPEGEARLRLDGFFVTIRPDGSRTYGGSVRNASPAPLSGLEAIVSYFRDESSRRTGRPADVEPPRKRKTVEPAFVENARVQGRVILEAIVDERGTVGAIRVMRSIPPLDPAAIEAVRQWEYEPLRVRGIAVPFLLTTQINFGRRSVEVEEAIAEGGVIQEPFASLEPGEAREFTLALPPLENGAYYNVQLRFVIDDGGTRSDVPTLRQKKTITSR
jgi:TonB family protein